MNKKGIFQDGIYIIAAFFIAAIGILVAYAASDLMNDAFQDNTNIPVDTKSQFNDFNTKFPNIFDWVFMTVFIGIIIGGIMLSYIVPANPIIFVVMILFTLVIGGLGGYISNAWESSTNDGGLMQNSASYFTMTDFVMNHFLTIIIIVFLLMTIVFYAKPDGGFQ